MPLPVTWTGDLPWMALLFGLMSIVTALLVFLLPVARPVRALVPIPIRSREAERRAALAESRRRHAHHD
ncbi:MAG: hypothetical protein HQL91_07835 [Magnetococcales bacterium]|nr:hypothetical protein [Magnetococcales bacterium]